MEARWLMALELAGLWRVINVITLSVNFHRLVISYGRVLNFRCRFASLDGSNRRKKKRNIQITFFVTKVKIGSLYSRSGEEVDMGRQENGHFRYPHSVAVPSESKMA
jgi:hypothetical protein